MRRKTVLRICTFLAPMEECYADIDKELMFLNPLATACAAHFGMRYQDAQVAVLYSLLFTPEQIEVLTGRKPESDAFLSRQEIGGVLNCGEATIDRAIMRIMYHISDTPIDDGECP